MRILWQCFNKSTVLNKMAAKFSSYMCVQTLHLLTLTMNITLLSMGHKLEPCVVMVQRIRSLLQI